VTKCGCRNKGVGISTSTSLKEDMAFDFGCYIYKKEVMKVELYLNTTSSICSKPILPLYWNNKNCLAINLYLHWYVER